MRLVPVLVLLLGLLPGSPLPAFAQQARHWTLDPGESRLGFIFTQSGGEYEGSFAEWTAEIVFDEQDLENSSLEVTIDMGSAETGNDDRDGLLRSAMLFDTQKFPEARFVAGEIERTGENSFEARGQLTIRDVTRDVVLPFTLAPEGDDAVRAQGRLEIARLDYGVGQGQWRDTSMVADAVVIVLELLARPEAG